MCTAISVTCGNHYFGRNLDFEHTFGEQIIITPRLFPLAFQNGTNKERHDAIIGMALNFKGYPLYFDAANESGLSMAGLLFSEYAEYKPHRADKENVASYELIPYVLTQCKTVMEAEKLLSSINITNDAVDKTLPPSPLHWMVSDKEKSIVVEQTRQGLSIHQNPAGVLTNAPTFDVQMLNLRNFLSVSPSEPKNLFSDKLNLTPIGRGTGAIGLPGDYSSMSRFVRACFTKLNAVFGETEEEIVTQFFHILYAVYQHRGAVRVGDFLEITNYTSCINTDKGIYYYTTYSNSTICAVDMMQENLDGKDLIVHDVIRKTNIYVHPKKNNA